MSELLALLRGSKAYDLAQPYFTGMPHYPTHPPFLFSLTKQHGDFVAEGGVSSAADALTLGGHVGTHIDALCHFSLAGKLHGGVEAASVQSYGEGVRHLSIDTVGLVARRGILLDIAAQQGMDALPADFEITPEHMEKTAAAEDVRIEQGDIVLLRTGWGRYWRNPAEYLAQGRGPGPAKAGASWFSARGVFAAGSDTISFEKIPDPSMPVHVHLLVENGIHIIETLNLEELARAQAYSFVFIAAPLKIRGGTGSPIRPFALV